MTKDLVRAHIKHGSRWTLVMHYDDGEFGCLDATTRAAELLMVEQAHCVVGIYRPEQERYFRDDMARRSPAWPVAA